MILFRDPRKVKWLTASKRLRNATEEDSMEEDPGHSDPRKSRDMESIEDLLYNRLEGMVLIHISLV
jgi:hypothetical protein